MSTSDQYNIFRQQVAEILDIDALKLDSAKLCELAEFDSMARINIGLLIEDEFGWQIPFEELDKAGPLNAVFERVLENSGG